jgi:hypothetical protein
MDREIRRTKIQGVIIAFAIVVVLIGAAFLAVFLLTQPASVRDVAQGEVLKKALADLPQEKELKQSIQG